MGSQGRTRASINPCLAITSTMAITPWQKVPPSHLSEVWVLGEGFVSSIIVIK